MKISQIPYKIIAASADDLIFIERPTDGAGSIKFSDLKTSLNMPATQTITKLLQSNDFPYNPELNETVFIKNTPSFHADYMQWNGTFWEGNLQSKDCFLSALSTGGSCIVNLGYSPVIKAFNVSGKCSNAFANDDLKINLIDVVTNELIDSVVAFYNNGLIQGVKDSLNTDLGNSVMEARVNVKSGVQIDNLNLTATVFYCCKYYRSND